MKKTIGYVLSHTHWDREWYLSFQLFRMRLVDMLDTLIPYLEQHPEFPHFHLDGQTVCLEDYLEVRPDQAERLRHLIEAGRIAVGPWYVLPDLQCIGQESILRNLSRGLALAQRFGGGTPVGYLPDIFSHPAQLPQIFAGYGFRAAVIWRGSSDDPEPPYEVLWRAPDGTQLLTLRLPDDRGYLNAFPLGDTPEAVSRQFEDWFHERLPRSPSGQLLFMNGCDHQAPNYALPEFIRYFNETHDDYELRQISLTQYLDELHITPGELTVLCGEQNRTNYSAGRHLNPTLKNTFSTHIPQKIENAQCEAGLVRCAEPLSAMLAAAHLPLGLHYLDTAWKYLLQNHPHDSICGCSCDDVARDMERRFAWARDITQQYQQEAMRRLTAQTDTQQTLADEIPVHLFHLSPWPEENAIQTFTLRLPADTLLRGLAIRTADGQDIPCQIVRLRKDGVILHPMDRDPSWDDYLLADVLVQLPHQTAMSWTTLYCRPSIVPLSLPERPVVRFQTLENEYLQVSIQPNGTLDVKNKRSGTAYRGLNLFTDEADIGDAYLFSPELTAKVWNSATSAPSIRIQQGALCTSAILDWRYRRKPDEAEQSLRLTLSLRKNDPLLRFHLEIENRAGDHRLRVHFPTGFSCDESFADSIFTVEAHPIRRRQPKPEAWVETESGCYAQRRFVYLQNGRQRLVFMGAGLLEYEASDGENGADLAVTLLRAVGRCGSVRSMTAYAPPGPCALYPQDSQLLGNWEMEYALAFDTPDSELSMLAERYHTPELYYQDTAHPAQMQESAQNLFCLDVPEFVVSCVQGLGDGEILIRGYQHTGHSLSVSIRFCRSIQTAWRTDFTGNRREAVETSGDTLAFSAPHAKIMTFVVRL